MPPRLARSSVSTAKPHNARKKHQKRNLDAFSIASHSVPESQKLRRHRLGEVEGGDESRRKRQRMDDEEDDEEDDEDEDSGRARAYKKKGNRDELDLSGGSDSEGHTWRMGEVDDDDDSEIDSDEAFGESDEERFEGFVFRGSSKGKQSTKPSSRKERDVHEEGDPIEIDLNESEEDEEDDDSFGEEGVDLATMLDQPYSDSEEEESNKKKGRTTRDDSESPSEEEDIGEDGFSDLDMSDAEDAGDDNKQAKLKRLISSLQPEELEKKQRRGVDVHESSAPSEFGVTSQQKLSLEDLLPTVNDPALRKSLKLLKDDSKSAKRNGIPGKLEAPLPKRQQDRINRVAANEKTNETLNRWVDTVKHNRRAEHLSFPLVDPEAAEPQGVSRLLPVAPLNDLESTIQSILQESGLAAANGKTDEDQLLAFEELQTNKLPVEEVLARRAELRKQRELLFREEIRAKRVKKIKSKAYRRVHRKERERIAERERDMLKAEGIDVSEDEKEYNDRRRAEERMGAKHRESKWAKGMKASGRAVWDEDARAAVTDMARRNEELRRRIEGKDVTARDNDDSDVSDEDEDEDDSDGEHGADDPFGLRRQLEKLQATANGGSSKLGSMLFMQRAEAAKKARTDEDIERIRKELAGEDSQDEESEPDHMSSGRRKYGPSSKQNVKPAIDLSRSEFEEQEDPAEKVVSEDEVDIVIDKGMDKKSGKQQKQSQQKSTKGGLSRPLAAASHDDDEPEESNPWITGPKTKESKRSKSTAKSLELTEQKKTSNKAGISKSQPAEAPAPDSDGWTVVTYANSGAPNGNHHDNDSDSDDSDAGAYNPLALGNDPLIAKAFAGDEVVADFNAEKAATTAAEDTQIVDDTLPGWGNWVGANVSKRDRKRNTGRFLTTKQGLEAAKRKDAKLEKVIINEKRVKKNTKFLAGELPFPFETREQYERSLRIPKGKEWTTKSVFQQNTKPRVLVKKGVVIEAMSKPMV